ncbi:discoidin domain-containing protein [Pseudomonadota bacterium]
MSKSLKALAIACLASTWALSGSVSATVISTGSASATTGSLMCQSGYSPAQCHYQAYDISNNLAYGASATASSTIAGYSAIHDIGFINDGFYGNGRSWIAGTANSWITIDLGAEHDISQLSFGRDRLSGFDDRDPGQFLIDVALSDGIFSNIVDSSILGFNGIISGNQTVLVDLDSGPVTARYIKMTFSNAGTAIDEIEVNGVPVPATLALMALGLAGLGVARKRGKAQ